MNLPHLYIKNKQHNINTIKHSKIPETYFVCEAHILYDSSELKCNDAYDQKCNIFTYIVTPWISEWTLNLLILKLLWFQSLASDVSTVKVPCRRGTNLSVCYCRIQYLSKAFTTNSENIDTQIILFSIQFHGWNIACCSVCFSNTISNYMTKVMVIWFTAYQFKLIPK